MHPFLTRRTVLTTLAVSLAAACIPRTPGDPGIPAAMCQPRCARIHECDSSVDVAACVDQCANATGPRAIYLREDVVAAARACAERQACVSQMATAIKICRVDAYRRLEPSAVDRTYCARRLEKEHDCFPRPRLDTEHCLAFSKGFTDPILDQLADCYEQSPCRWIGRCRELVIGEDPLMEDLDRERTREYRPIPSLKELVAVGGTVTDETNHPVSGAAVCVVPPGPSQDQVACATSDAVGVYLLNVPAHAEIAITARAQGFTPVAMPITTVGSDRREFSIRLRAGSSDANLHRLLATQPPGETTGALRAFAVGPSGSGALGATFAIDPTSGRGPMYFSDAGDPDPSRKAASSWGSHAYFGDLKPGEVVVTVSAASRSCVPTWGGWPSEAPGSARVPILAGFETRVAMLCQ